MTVPLSEYHKLCDEVEKIVKEIQQLNSEDQAFLFPQLTELRDSIRHLRHLIAPSHNWYYQGR